MTVILDLLKIRAKKKKELNCPGYTEECIGYSCCDGLYEPRLYIFQEDGTTRYDNISDLYLSTLEMIDLK